MIKSRFKRKIFKKNSNNIFHYMSHLKKDFFFYIYLIAFFFISNLLLLNSIDKAFSDGLFMENLPPASVGDREASLFTKISPPILTSDNKENPYFQLRLFDAKNNETIKFVSYFITVEKGDKLLMRDLFQCEQGPLKLKINPANSET